MGAPIKESFSVPPVIELADVDLTLGDGAARVHVLKGVSLSIDHGQTVGLLGPSGSGKSTLLMTLAGLERPDSGSVRIDGRDMGALSEDALARFRGEKIGVVFQSFQLIPTMTALENVAVPLELAGKPDAFAIAEAELAAVGLSDRLAHYPAQLSGGEQQRVALARAVAPHPALLLADEPTGNLDGSTGHAIIDLMFGEAARLRSTLILITHDENLAALCDRVVRIEDGKVKTIEVRPHNMSRQQAAD
jgi:putative ABC transport system ATP-binding protein